MSRPAQALAPNEPTTSNRTTRPVARRRHWRIWWTLLVIVLVLALGFFIGGAWYFSGRIQSGALAVEPGSAMPAYDDVRVVSVSTSEIQLRVAKGDQPALSKPELYGIAWQGGVGQLGPAAAESGGVVTRPFTLVSGTPPASGQLAAIDRAYWLAGPQSLGIPIEQVVVNGPLGELPAWYFPGRGTTWVIAVHGQNGPLKDELRTVDVVHRLGFPALAISYRNDLGTTADPSNQLRYGQSEWPDLQAAVQWAQAKGAQHVVLAGQSMGGAIVAAFLEQSSLAPSVTRVIFDSAMLDLRSVVAWGAEQTSLPVVGLPVPGALVWTAEQIAGLRYGLDWSKLDYLDDVSWLTVPTLTLHGTDDLKVPDSISARLAHVAPGMVTYDPFPGAGHVESWNIDRARYTAAVEQFLAPVAP
jgi:alpha-beta hydrolase superfamily lysophospholipase